jgi:hypothetical protein
MSKTNTDRFHGKIEVKLENIESDVACLKEDVKELRNSVNSINNKFVILAVLFTVAVIERLPSLLSFVLAQ